MPSSKPTPPTTLTAITANDLASGRVVYLSKNGWSEDTKTALTFKGEQEANEALKKAEADIGAVGAYIIELEQNLMPATNREQIRSKGPTIHPELGKQGKNE